MYNWSTTVCHHRKWRHFSGRQNCLSISFCSKTEVRRKYLTSLSLDLTIIYLKNSLYNINVDEGLFEEMQCVASVWNCRDTKPVTRVFIFSNCMRVRQNLLLLFHTEEGSLLNLAALPGLGASSRIKSKIWLKKVGNQLPMSNVVFLQNVNIKFAMHGHAVDFWFMFTSPVLKRFCRLTQLNTSCRYSNTANFKRNPKMERMRGQVKTF